MALQGLRAPYQQNYKFATFDANPVVPYNENSLYNLYCMAYNNFESNIKQHLPRHMLGYLQEKMGLASSPSSPSVLT
jgi:hypothetical protein